ncbi:MMPL family transporter [Nocardia sp. XZ_19_385]|uniref:MMPL family transporter n=1 Tax=Nocardia sp. XZ_19_385 TaxID=2769488 RepID=UPI001E2DE93A|nr:MMPL family transporter [Nocardia sp. XZ_19_385]
MFAGFTSWGDLVVRQRFAVIGVVLTALLGLGLYGLGLGDRLSADGWDDPGSESVRAAVLHDAAFGRDHSSDVLLLFHAPDGKTIDDLEFGRRVAQHLDSLPRRFPGEISKINGSYWKTETGVAQPFFGTSDKKHAFAAVAIRGADSTEMARNFRKVEDVFEVQGLAVEVAGGQAVGGALSNTMAEDQQRMELLAIPAVAILLFFVFGGVVAAALPLVAGGLTVLAAWGVVRVLTHFSAVNSFVAPVVSMIGLGLAIDYGLFMVSRFREELEDGRDVPDAVRRTVRTAGHTVVVSAIIVVAASSAMLLFPHGFLRSFAFGTIATVTLAALIAVTLLPATLCILGRRVDMLGFTRFRRVGSSDFWGRTCDWVLKHPLRVAIPVCGVLLLLILPVGDLAFGAISERYLPPDHPTRLAQQHFDELFPLRGADPIQLLIVSENPLDVGAVRAQVDRAPGLTGPFSVPSRGNGNVFVTQAAVSENARPAIEYLRAMPLPQGTTVLVGGQPAIGQDSIDALVRRMPLMIVLVLLGTTALLAFAFRSLVLPLKAAVLNALGLGSTLGILTWIFVEGHGAGLLNFTPQPIMALVLVLIIALVYGLSTDYEVFLLSRMVEAREAGASTAEAVRIGTARTGRIITAAALILMAVTGAFAFSDLLMMQYIAYGMLAALFIDAVVLRMLLVPAAMRLLGEACWWAPAWLKPTPTTHSEADLVRSIR